MDKNTLKKVSEWAQSRVDTGEEPPWTYNKLKMLAELTAEFSAAMESSTPFLPGMDFVGEHIDPQSENIVYFKPSEPQLDDPDVPLPA